MRLWTIQPRSLYEKLKIEKILHCEPLKSEFITEWGFVPAYDWLAEQMTKRIGAPPDNVNYPFWAWYMLDGENHKPDLRRREFRNYYGEMVCIELEIPDEDVLLSDEVMWHIVLNNGYYGNSSDEAEYEKDKKWFDSLSAQKQNEIKRKSWEKIFEVYPPVENDWESRGFYVQATFWELKFSQVKSVRYFMGKLKKLNSN